MENGFRMKFGLITPVFDGCLGSLELVSRDIFQQTCTNWVWILCSNGYSEKIDRFVREKDALLARDLSMTGKFLRIFDRKIIYLHTGYEELPDGRAILANVGKRRDLCIRKIKSDYILMIDADAKLADNDMFRTINEELEKDPKDLCIYKIIRPDIGTLPIFPICYGRIDMLNFCVRSAVARKVGYPTTVNPAQPGNDYWFFNRVYTETNGDYLFIDKVFGVHNGNNTYITLGNQL
jgi:hypothetical protein